MYDIVLKPIYSRLASEMPDTLKIPANYRLSWHQVETWKAINNLEIDVIFNTAMTGDGKSLAAYLHTLQGDFSVMGLYPTNELARDQVSQIEDYVAKFKPPDEPRINRLSGAELELYAEQEDLSKQAAIATRSKQSEIILTNPDIFHYLHRGAYLTHLDNRDKLWGRVDKNFDLFIFDEFHVFAVPQIASILNTMMLIRRTNRQKKFLFLSATPNEELLTKLDKAGFRYKCIDPIAEGKYQFPENDQQAEELKAEEWRQIARKINLSFVPLESTFQSSEVWLKENQELVLRHFQQSPNTKGAIILNSIASVKRLIPIFRELLEPHGLTVGENTGLSGSQEKIKSLSCDLVLGTSTIDVGVDFKINFLIFESSDTGNFIQRLGRLGRHGGYEKNGEDVKFDDFTAYALVPKFLVERLFKADVSPLEINGQYDRVYLNQTIRENYRQINNFEGYYKRWGAVQSFQLCYDLGSPTIQEKYLGSREKLQQDCETVFDTKLKRVAGCIKKWSTEWQALSGKKGNPIFEDASSFRGSSPLLCGLYDETESNQGDGVSARPLGDRFKTYDLPGILSNLEIETMTEAYFMQSLEKTAESTGQPIPKGRFRHCLAFMKLRSYREERLNWRFTYSGNLQEKAEAWKVQVLTGITIWQPDNFWISKINSHLKQQGLVSYVISQPVNKVRQALRLPMYFAIYPISDQTSIHDPTPPYSIAIGQSALLLDTLAYRLKSKGGETWIC